MLSYKTLKKILFKLDPETAHNFAERSLVLLGKCKFAKNYYEKKNFIEDDILEQELFSRVFKNPIGLAAGFDKNATMVKSMKSLGFGFTEIGTVTLVPQDGNPKPRMFRHIDEKSLQNAMGFNNLGAHKVLKNLKKLYPFNIPIGVNIGKNKNTPEEFAINDYKNLIKKLQAYSDYLIINISSPNTPNLRDLQNEKFIKELFSMAKKLSKKPIFLKIAPDMDIDAAISLCEVAIKEGASGIIANNTTIDYTLVKEPKDFGGLSGECLKEKSSQFFNAIANKLYGKTTLISVGGISNANDAYERIKDGANLVQIYSSLVFEGPSLAKNINLELIELLKKDGYENIKEAIGANFRK